MAKYSETLTEHVMAPRNSGGGFALSSFVFGSYPPGGIGRSLRN